MDQETITTEAPGKETGAEDNHAGNPTTVEDLANSFIERVEESPEPETPESEAVESAEAEEGEAEDVLSQSNKSEEEETEEESEAEEAEEESEVEPPKGLGKLLKQVGKLTARSKTAEEKVEALQAEISTLKSQPQEQATPQGSPALEEIADLASLEKVRQEAIAAKKWAVQHLGKEFVEDGDKEYSGDEIREIFGAADEYLTEKIPQRAQFLQAKEQWATDTSSTFTFLAEQEGESYELYQQVRNGPQYKQMLDGLPNGDFVAATLVTGIQALKAESKGKKPAKKRSAKTPPTTLEESVAPPPQPKDDRRNKKVKDAIAAGNISADQFADLLT